MGMEQRTDLADLGQRLYNLALIRNGQESITNADGEPIAWLLDTRIPMLSGPMAREVGEVLAGRLRTRGLEQVAGYGFGAYAIICATIGSSATPPIRGGFIRHGRKGHGRRRIVEGPLDKSMPVVLMDDILNSGATALRAVQLLRAEGFSVEGVAVLFEFTWSRGRSRLESEGLWVDSLLDLSLPPGSPVGANSA